MTKNERFLHRLVLHKGKVITAAISLLPHPARVSLASALSFFRPLLNPVLLALHWLPVKFRISYKIAVISFKAIYNLGPAYLSNLINIKRCSRYSLRSNVGVILQDPTAKFKCTLRDRSFTAAAPKIWNGLPDYIRKENDFGYV